MSPNELIIIVFAGLIVLYLYKTKNKFFMNLFGFKDNKYEDDEEIFIEHPVNKKDLSKDMKPLLEQQQKNKENVLNEYYNHKNNSMNIASYYPNYQTGEFEDIPYDAKRHEYKLEKDHKQVIADMKKNNEELELRNVYNNMVKNHQEIDKNNPEPKPSASNVDIETNENGFAFLENSNKNDVGYGDLIASNTLNNNFATF